MPKPWDTCAVMVNLCHSGVGNLGIVTHLCDSCMGYCGVVAGIPVSEISVCTTLD